MHKNDGFQGWISRMDIKDGYQGWISGMDIMDGYHGWISWMDIMDGYQGWISGLDIKEKIRCIVGNMARSNTPGSLKVEKCVNGEYILRPECYI